MERREGANTPAGSGPALSECFVRDKDQRRTYGHHREPSLWEQETRDQNHSTLCLTPISLRPAPALARLSEPRSASLEPATAP